MGGGERAGGRARLRGEREGDGYTVGSEVLGNAGRGKKNLLLPAGAENNYALLW